MQIAPEAGDAWRRWVLVTSIPLVRLDGEDVPGEFGSGTLIDHAGARFLVSAEHVVKQQSTGWSAVVQQAPDGQLEYYKPNVFTYVGELRKGASEIRILDLCAARVAPTLQTWYEERTPRGLFDRQPNHVFHSDGIAEPNAEQVYAFSGRVRTERHGDSVYASEMAAYPGLTYSHTDAGMHHFRLPVPHPGHDAFRGCSGSPIVDFNRRVVGIVVGGDITTNCIKAVAIQRVLANLEFLAAQG